jgi:hypothetical protein
MRHILTCHQGKADLKGRAFTNRTFERNAAAHALDDALGNAQAKARTAIAPRNALVGLFKFAENALLGLGRNADAGVAHQEGDFVGPDAGLDDDCHAAGCGELDRITSEIEQHLPQPRGIADHVRR